MNKSLELFYKFLESKGALITWEQNYLNEQTETDNESRAEFFYKMIRINEECTFISNAFTWKSTPQGYDYWFNLHSLWRNYLSQNN